MSEKKNVDTLHLEAATNPGLMREIFQRYLPPLGEKTYEVLDCQISFARHRGLDRRKLHYTLRLVELGTKRERSLLLTGTTYPEGRTKRIWEKLRRSELGRGLPGTSSSFESFFYIPDLDMLVQVFPYDHRLPALRFLMEERSPELEGALLAVFGPGDWRTEAWDAKPVRYRVGMRATLQLTVQARDAATDRVEVRCFYAKVYRHEHEGEQAYQVLRELQDKASTGGNGFAVGKPVAYLSGLRTLVQEEVPGVSLLDILLRRGEEEAIPAVRRAASAVASLHLLDLAPSRRRRLRDEVVGLEDAGKLLRSVHPHLSQRIEEILSAVMTGLEEVAPAPTHGDLAPRHIFLAGDCTALVDFDKFAGSDPILDVADLLFLLAKARPHATHLQERQWALARAFTEEYFIHVPVDWKSRLTFHYASVLLRKAAGSFQHRDPGSSDEVENLLEEAENSLRGKIW